MMIKWGIFLLGLIVLLFSCNSRKNDSNPKEDLTAKQMLQGVWLDDQTEIPLMYIKGDTIYYADPQNVPVYFKIIGDTIYNFGNQSAAYKIDRQTENIFWFHTLADEIVKLYKSDNPEDSLSFSNKTVEVIPAISEITKKDSVVMYKGTRYRGYVYINPSKMKVTKTSYSEEGISVDNVYYDNVIHICVYEGKKLLYGQDITKQMFANVLPLGSIDQMILSGMNFMGVDSKGYHYQAILGVPESYVSNLIDITIDFDNKLSIKKTE